MKAVILIAGPTASGKSRFAVDLARAHHGEVINADALQVYSDLRVISARPVDEEMQGVPHHLFGHIDGAHRYSAGQWLREASEVILDVLARGKVPIVVGGTGLYFKSLTEGLAQVPSVDVTNASNFLKSNGISRLRLKAESLDPVAASRVLGDDPQRLLRIVSVAEETGRCLSEWRADTTPIIPSGFWRSCVLLPPRNELYERINARFDTMVDAGGLEEVRLLAQRGLSSDLPVMRAIGVKTIAQHLSGTHDLVTGIELAKRDTRRFAKRQMTWFRGQAPNWPKIENITDKECFKREIF